MKRQNGFYNLDFTSIFVALIIIGAIGGIATAKGCGYLYDHIEITWVSDDAKAAD